MSFSSKPSDETVFFAHYRVLRRDDGGTWKLGQGAMGSTYLAFDERLDKVVVLKVVDVSQVERESSRERFLREAGRAARVSHRNVAAIYDLGQDAHHLFYAMEYVKGETLDSLVKRDGPRPWREALEITAQAARALQAVHEKYFIHRDIKPANLMLVPEPGGESPTVKLIDFGLATTLLEEGNRFMTTGSGFVGTPQYASPEQFMGEAPDIRSDIYSLGVTLWFMLTGQSPFTGPAAQIGAQHVSAPPPLGQLPADVPGSVRAVLGWMLAKERDERPSTSVELRRELEACLRDEPPSIPTMISAPRVPSPSHAGGAGPRDPAASQRITGPQDRVTFTAFTPSRIIPATSFLFDLWAHTDAQHEAVAQQAARLGGDRTAALKAGVAIARGTVLGVVLEIPSLRVTDASESLVWSGEPVNAVFAVEVPAEAAGGSHPGRAFITAAGIPVTKLAFVIQVETAHGIPGSARSPLPVQATRPRTAFASYSSRDRAEVLTCIRGMRKIDPELDVFVDVLTLRAGQRWAAELETQIPTRDAFFLFWSENAARSPEVEKEWRLALETRGPDFIDPVPLVDPREVPPPAELCHLHFNDLYLAHIGAIKALQSKSAPPWWKFW